MLSKFFNLLILISGCNSDAIVEVYHRIKYENVDEGVMVEKNFYLSPSYIKINWTNASNFCMSHGMRLAGVRSRSEQDELFKHFQQRGIFVDHIWTGLRDERDDNFWRWSEERDDLLDYELKWSVLSKEPDIGRGHTCGHINYDKVEGFSWGDYTCDEELNFLCEVPAKIIFKDVYDFSDNFYAGNEVLGEKICQAEKKVLRLQLRRKIDENKRLKGIISNNLFEI